jgi:hypothetical protein
MPSFGTKMNPKASTIAEHPLDNVELLCSITLGSPECIKVVAPDGRLLQMNPAGLVMIESEDWDSVKHASTLDLLAPEHRDAWLRHHKRVCAGERLVWEFDIIGLKGTRRSMETHAAPIALGGSGGKGQRAHAGARGRACQAAGK